MPDTTGKTAIVTGANGGIGRSVARNLAAAGARVVLAVRSTENGNEAAAGMRGGTEVYGLDVASSDPVQAFAARWHGPIDLLINNAGVWAPSLTRTAGGFESEFGTDSAPSSPMQGSSGPGYRLPTDPLWNVGGTFSATRRHFSSAKGKAVVSLEGRLTPDNRPDQASGARLRSRSQTAQKQQPASPYS
jgi:NAD(P)-dependent dehydrogenase (short-subunit alcohol dehydrogenase family)